MSSELDDKYQQLLKIVQDAIARDVALRTKYEIDVKFRFVSELLEKLAGHLQNIMSASAIQTKETRVEIADDEQPVYVYLFNAQGIALRSWQNMLSPRVFYEYSVNRPIYTEKTHIEALLRTKANKVQHAYLAIAIKKADIINADIAKDALGQPVAKVREGSLLFNRLLTLTHNEQDYQLNETGELVKK